VGYWNTLISYYTGTPLDAVEQWTYNKWLNTLAHIAAIRQREKDESYNEAVRFENMRRR
jgi:hypothetical protein